MSMLFKDSAEGKIDLLEESINRIERASDKLLSENNKLKALVAGIEERLVKGWVPEAILTYIATNKPKG